jgi:hypothetical protein
MMVDLDGRVLLTEDIEESRDAVENPVVSFDPELDVEAELELPAESYDSEEVEPETSPQSLPEPEPESEVEYFQMPNDEESHDLGVEAFAQSERSSAEEGLYLYEVSIEDLDTQEIIADVRKVLEDPRFELDTEHLFQDLLTNKGILKVRDLGPVKASMLLARLHSFPIVISWEQYLVHGEETKK